jgi:hypothetical protein
MTGFRNYLWMALFVIIFGWAIADLMGFHWQP